MVDQKNLFRNTISNSLGKKKESKSKKVSSNSLTKKLPSYFAPLDTLSGEKIALGSYASTQYLQYAIATVKDRALPRVTDGQKPVQSRILYAMSEMNAASANPRKKSARVVGDVLGKFHPHGDASVYDAMVRMAQEFTLRYPLIDGEGNFGSRDGDSPAAMRYTEARLTAFADILLGELDLGTVDFHSNYDGSTKEPMVLPARLPLLLLNGASGIAVGMATDIPSHNLLEISSALIKLIANPELKVRKIMRYIKGPDFPGGGQVISTRDEIISVYETGRGSLRVRAKWSIEKLARGQWQLVVTELPPGISAKKVLEEVDVLCNPQARSGKKTLNNDQIREKQLALSLLDTVRDESGRVHPVRLVFEPRSTRVVEKDFVNFLLAKTSLEGNVSINLVTLGIDGSPATKNLVELLKEWLAFRVITVTRRTETRLAKVEDRIHILEGRLSVILNIEQVIKIIRSADEPKSALKREFDLTEKQADDILEIRLRQLAKLEDLKIEKELKELKKEKRNLVKILKNRKDLEQLIVSEIKGDVELYGDKRRTSIEASEKANLERPVSAHPLTVIFSEKGWVRARQGWEIDVNALTFKKGDELSSVFEIKANDPVIFLDSKGRAYTVDASALPSARGDGVPSSSLVDVQDDAHIMYCLCGKPDDKVLIASSGGYGFLTRIEKMVSNRKAGREFIIISDGCFPLRPFIYSDHEANYVAALSERGRMLLFSVNELRSMNRGVGTILMGLHEQEKLMSVAVTNKRDLRVIGRAPRTGKTKAIQLRDEKLANYASRRARMGRVLPVKLTGKLKIRVS